MASVSVVGPRQLRSAPEQHIFHSKPTVTGRKKISVRTEAPLKMMFRKSSLQECGSVSAGSGVTAFSLNLSLTSGHQVAPAGIEVGNPWVKCETHSGLVPRSSDKESDSRSLDCGHPKRNTTTPIESDIGQSGRSSSVKDFLGDEDSSMNVANVLSSTSANGDMANDKYDRSVATTNGHTGAHSHRNRSVRRRKSVSTPDGKTWRETNEASGGPPLERLTQGRTGVVKLVRTEPHRREAWSIFVSHQEDPRVLPETGDGHLFGTRTVTQDWCDVCNQRIIAQQALKCKNCRYTCHPECEEQVQLDCNQRDNNPQETPSPRNHYSTPSQYKQNEVKEEPEGGPKVLSEEEVRARIEDYNSKVSENGMSLATDGSYTGFIKVRLRLSRPVTVSVIEGAGLDTQGDLAERLPDGAGGAMSDKRTSFYMPIDCVKQIHICSSTTVKEVIQGLLRKYMVLDNPRKFALYRQTHRDGQDLFQKLPPVERPLALRLEVGPDAELLSFVLKENETEEVEWHAFSVPELQNFLVILDKEEAERVRLVKQRFETYREKLQKALQENEP